MNSEPAAPGMTISDAIDAYIDSVNLARSANTTRTYRNGLKIFQVVLKEHELDPRQTPVATLKEEPIVWLATALKDLAPTTERLYLTAATSFYEYLAGESLAVINLPRIHLLIRQRARRPGQRLPQFPRDAIEQIVEAMLPRKGAGKEEVERLRELRDRAFLITLADTGLRVHEACGLRRGDLDWNEGRAIIIGKGNKQAVVRFSQRALHALRDYLGARAQVDGTSGRPLAALPLFARHDRGAGKKVKPITTATGRNIVAEWVKELLGEEAVGTITPHSFRHYFVTRVLQSSGNLKLAQELARHTSIAVTQRYAHLSDDELDKGYFQAFEEDG
ncbi:MAG TPA: tyrosine-type recombinase/integrase [Anaerolineaceae bacterium]